MPSTALPLPTGLSGLDASPKTREEVKNLFYTRGKIPVLALRPGVDLIALTGGGRCRGQGLFRNNLTGDEELYQVSGQKLQRITITNPQARKVLTSSDILIEDLGVIDGATECILVGGFSRLLIMQVGGKGFVFDQVNGLEEITDPQFLPSVSVVYDDGRFVFIPLDGDVFFWSLLDDPASILPENFADAEIFPDPNKAVWVDKSILYVAGSRSVQLFSYDAIRDTYITYEGRESKKGYVGGLVKFGETHAFLGNSSDGNFDFYVMADEPKGISSDYVAELLNDEYSLPELTNIVGQSVEWEGTPIIIFYLPRHTLVYYGDWALWHSGIQGGQDSTWRINHIQSAYGFQWTGDDNNDRIGVLRDSGNEYGDDIEWGLLTKILATPETNGVLRRVTVRATMGKSSGSSVPRIALQISKDGRIPGKIMYRTLGDQGNYNAQLRWGAPLAKGYDYLGLQFTGYGNVIMNVDGVFIE